MGAQSEPRHAVLFGQRELGETFVFGSPLSTAYTCQIRFDGAERDLMVSSGSLILGLFFKDIPLRTNSIIVRVNFGIGFNG
jgi:hypothetical protein